MRSGAHSKRTVLSVVPLALIAPAVAVAGVVGAPVCLAQAAELDQKTYQGVGVVVALVPRMQALVVSHDEIKGFMAAMEMMYRVSAPVLLGGLEPGDKIGFTIDAASSTITEIKVMQRGK